jgi:hypothetical protein
MGSTLVLALADCSNVSPGQPGTATIQSFAGSATLSWTPVTANTDGTALEDLAGYQVHYGPSLNAMSTVVVLPDPGQTTYIVSPLTSGTWYFAVAAYTSSGIEGAWSNVATKIISPQQ